MDDDSLWRLLEKLDESEEAMWPTGFDNRVETERFHATAAALEQALGAPLKREDFIQDATFHARLWLSTTPEQSIYFSNFGSLVALWDDRQLSPELVERVRLLVEARGYVYVPCRLLVRPWAGKWACFATFWDRYFSWP